MRWLVTLATRAQTPQADGTGIDELWIDLMQVHVSIEATSPNTYYDSMQVDTPASHMITMRWVNSLRNTQAIKRVTLLPNGESRTEIFRVRRIKELDGRKRFVDIEVQLESETL